MNYADEVSDPRGYMRRCIALARRAPFELARPHVGALLLSASGRVIGEGYRCFIDGTRLILHAERAALERIEPHEAKDATLFSTLEPCAPQSGKGVLRSCCELIVEYGIDRVVYGLADTSPSMRGGKGINFLCRNGVRVERCDGLAERIRRELMDEGYRS